MAHYVDNKTLYKVMVEYKDSVNDAEAVDDPKPGVDESWERDAICIASIDLKCSNNNLILCGPKPGISFN